MVAVRTLGDKTVIYLMNFEDDGFDYCVWNAQRLPFLP